MIPTIIEREAQNVKVGDIIYLNAAWYEVTMVKVKKEVHLLMYKHIDNDMATKYKAYNAEECGKLLVNAIHHKHHMACKPSYKMLVFVRYPWLPKISPLK